MHALTHHLHGIAITGLALIVLVWLSLLNWERVVVWLLMALSLVYALGVVWLDSLGQKRAPARDWGRIRWFRSEASRRNLERREP